MRERTKPDTYPKSLSPFYVGPPAKCCLNAINDAPLKGGSYVPLTKKDEELSKKIYTGKARAGKRKRRRIINLPCQLFVGVATSHTRCDCSQSSLVTLRHVTLPWERTNACPPSSFPRLLFVVKSFSAIWIRRDNEAYSATPHREM